MLLLSGLPHGQAHDPQDRSHDETPHPRALHPSPSSPLDLPLPHPYQDGEHHVCIPRVVWAIPLAGNRSRVDAVREPMLLHASPYCLSSLCFPALRLSRLGLSSGAHLTRRVWSAAAAPMTPNEVRRIARACRPCARRWWPSAMTTRARRRRTLRLRTAQHASAACPEAIRLVAHIAAASRRHGFWGVMPRVWTL